MPNESSRLDGLSPDAVGIQVQQRATGGVPLLQMSALVRWQDRRFLSRFNPSNAGET